MNTTDIQLHIHSTIQQQLAAQRQDAPPRLDITELFCRLERTFDIPLDPARILPKVSTISDLSRLILRMKHSDSLSA